MAVLLLIDDDRGLLQLLTEFLTRQGHSIYAADCARDGLRAFYTHQPDLIVLDVTMPEKDGWETLKSIRDLSNVPVILLTARSDEADVLRGFSLGADDYVNKPFSFAQLQARIHAVLTRSSHSKSEEDTLIAGDLEVNISLRRVMRRGRVDQADANRIQVAGRPDASLGRSAHAGGTGARSVGTAIRQRDRIRPALHLALATETGTRRGAPALYSQ